MAKVAKKKGKGKSGPVKKLTRKEQRKQKTQYKKENKRLFFSSKTKGAEIVAQAKAAANHSQQSKKPKKRKTKKSSKTLAPEEIPIDELLGNVDSDNDESIASDFSDAEVDARLPEKIAKQDRPTPSQEGTKKKQKQPTRPDAELQRRRELRQQKDLESVARKHRVKQLMQENEDEDRLITKLEKKLKLNKTKDKNRLVRKMFSDGLDYALEFCLDDEEERRKRELKAKRKEEQQRQHDSGWSDEDGFGDEDDEVLGDGREGEGSDESDYSGGEDSETEDAEKLELESEPEAAEEFKEDIYGRKRDKEGNIIKDDAPAESNSNTVTQKYVPPHQRAQIAATAETDNKQTQLLERLRKNCKGLLNRLSEANLHKIATGIEDLYMKNSRYNMNETLGTLLREVLLARTIANERMVQEHMVLLAYLHAQVGNEIGAHFLQLFVEKFNTSVKEIHTLAVEDKQLNNLVLVLAYMYIFKIYEHRLLLEIIGRLADNLCEKSIECLLLIFQSVGFKLRKDDPLAFKEMMLSVQRKIAEAPLELKENLRLKFMVDILNAVKNNNINKIPQFDPELAENLRKRLKAMLRNDKYVTTLNITMDDLLRVDQVGKWWVVGSAWSGNINDINAAAKQAKDEDIAGGQRFSEKLLKLAKQQKMNTEERRNIFCIIMGAEDYVDAFEKILHLALKDQRSIAYVIIHCSLNEKRSNPYYAHLALKFCHHNRKYQLAFQFATWDRINDIESLTKLQVKNLARFLQHLILNGGLQLSVLKVVNFLQLDKLSFVFMKEIIVSLLLSAKEAEIYQAFERVAKNSKLSQFKNSVRLFIQHFLLQHESKLKLSEEQLALLKKRADYVDNILAYVDL